MVNTSPLIHGFNFLKCTNYLRLNEYQELSKAKMRFMVLCYIVNINPLKTSYFKVFGMNQQLIRGYVLGLVKLGYISRLSRYEYELTDKYRQFIASFMSQFNRMNALPFTWR
jgi:predicted transcriptional regulator